MSIRHLPDEVVAQIKSSTTIVSLTGVVLELLKNSLDAKASKIDVTVNFARGGCTVDDDGLGISPAEFAEDGGLGKLYCTSKYHPDEPQLGRNGTFLASLSAMSLLTITSHHHAYRSHNSISFHHAQAIERQLPTAAHNHVNGKHGTRVTVRNLFGNMPVRVKQRSLVTDQKAEHHRLRDIMKRETVGLLLSWRGPVSLKVRDGDNKPIINLRTSNAAVADESRSIATEKPRSANLSSLLNIMTQANYIAIDEWASWVPASASTPALSVKGAISLEPSPTKHVQFISFGLQPLSTENAHNELYDQVNRLFALSSFGTLEDDVDLDEHEKLRRQSDKRFKNDGFTNRQLKARKGVDRYPMFHLRISLKDRRASDLTEEQFMRDETNLQAVLDTLSAMVTQWLSVHHFRPRKLRRRADRPTTTSTPTSDFDKEDGTPPSKRQALSSMPARFLNGTPHSKVVVTDTAKRVRPATAPLVNASQRPRQQAFAEWSRIKSGKSSFFDGTVTLTKATVDGHTAKFLRPASNTPDSEPSGVGGQQEHAVFSIAPLPKGVLTNTPIQIPFDPENETHVATNEADETMLWTDLSTKKTHLLNARTGCVMPPRQPRPQTNSGVSAPTVTKKRMTHKPATGEPMKTPWLDGLLQTWDNPIFKPSEQNIQQVAFQGGMEEVGQQRSQHTHCSHFNLQKAFSDASSSSARLSKESLHRAEVVAQVDKKFVLVKILGSSPSLDVDEDADAAVLVLIDQHAADERIQVESLLANLCAPIGDDTHSGYRSQLGHTSLVTFVNLEKPIQFSVSVLEHLHFNTYAANFAAWGILYNVHATEPAMNKSTSTTKDAFKLSVTTLPPAISERCKSDPQLLISFLRSAVWKYVDAPPPSSSVTDDKNTSWVKKIATCPPGLIEMINSRACRSAIMFNDELSMDECRGLVSRLADCTFPFMCAHGRPSMVPIVGLGRAGQVVGVDDEKGKGEFVEAWKKWKR